MLRSALLSSVLILTSAAAPPLSVRDVDGRAWTPLAPGAGTVHVLFFISTDCPISNRYAPEIDRIASAYADRHVQTFLVYAEAAADTAHVRTHLREFHPSLHAPAIVDSTFDVTRAAGATVTPEAVVISRAGRSYRGRIDDLYVTLGQTRRAAQHHDLRDALNAVLRRAPVRQPETPAIGCFIDRSDK